MVKQRRKAQEELAEIDKQIASLKKLAQNRITDINLTSSQTEETRSLIAAKKEEIELAEKEVENAKTENELIAANQKLKKRNEEMEHLQKLGIEEKENTPKRPTITEKSILETELQNLENAYKERQLIINLNEEKEWQTETQHQMLLLAAEEKYLNNRITLLDNFNTQNKKLDAEANSKKLEAKLKLNEPGKW
ncbi:MAG: hypothetical protein LBP83_02520 [Dysgonamonadaceae bacterium]|jgi:hypothetical protein|nr:hypothetical protein [Dysgonamonadaceae bacterium]